MFWWLALALILRLPPLISGIIPFSFDHGRDALAALHLIKTFNPIFIGPWTSIPGLFFGPGWYYLIAPAYALFQGNPLAPAYLMLLLNLISVFLAYKYWGNVAAAIIAAAPAWITVSTSAVNPFPMAFLGLLLLIALKTKHYFWLGIIVGLGFHFSSALAIFWLLLIPFFVKPNHWLKLITGIIIPFIPQILFEIKNHGIEIKALIDYFSKGESQHLTPGKVAIVTKAYWHELALGIMPDYFWTKLIAWIILGSGFIVLTKERRLLILLLVPMFGFWFLHFNPWYVYGVLPFAVVASSLVLKRLPRLFSVIYIAILIVGAILQSIKFFQFGRSLLSTNKAFLPAKMTAINYIYSQAGDRPFSSYHYLPEIYDYAYQYLYLWQGFKGRPLPVEFSYQPKAPTYIREKADLLRLLPAPAEKPEKIFLIVEGPDNTYHYPFDYWLTQIPYKTVVAKKTIGPEIEVWQLSP